jgi:hypothetical protein
MIFEGHPVPGACWVEIVKVYNKDGTELEPDNWRQKLFGRVTLCWIAGGLRSRGAYFKGKIKMENGQPVEIDLHSFRWCSTTTAQPVEIEPGVFDFETNTSVYRFRLLSDEEENTLMDAIHEIIEEERKALLQMLFQPPAGDAGDTPVS